MDIIQIIFIGIVVWALHKEIMPYIKKEKDNGQKSS